MTAAHTAEAKHRRPPVAAGEGGMRVRGKAMAVVRRPLGHGRGVTVNRRSLEDGFTYIGVLVLIAIMGMAATLASELWQTAQKRENEQELLFIGNQFRRALAMYSANGGGNPQRLEDLLKDPRVPGVRRFLRKIYRDPMTGGTEWGLVRASGKEGVITGVYSLSEAEPLKQMQFAIADKEFEGKKKYSEWVFVAKPVQGLPGATAATASGAATPAGSGAATSAGSDVTAPAGSAATTSSNAGATQTDQTLNRAQSRVRR